MSSKKKTNSEEVEEIVTPVEETVETVKEAPKKSEKKSGKFDVGALVFISKDVLADLNGFCLFPQYKKEPYTVEAYDEKTGVYTLRQVKLLINLKEEDLVSPDENAHDSLNRKQF